MRLKLVIFILMIPIFIFGSEFYTLDELLQGALENNTTLKQANLNLQIARAGLHSSRVNYLPDLSAGIGRREDLENDQTLHTANFSVEHRIALNYDAYFQNRNARHDLNSAQIQSEIQRQNVIFNIIRNYITVLENQKRLALQEENIRIQENIVTESNLLFRQQRITQFDVQQSEINLLNARISAHRARMNLNDSRTRLFELVNITDEGKELADVELYTDFEIETFERELDFDQILRVMAQNETVNRHRTNITRTRLDFFPQVNLRYDFNRTLSSEDLAFDHRRTDHTVSLNLSYSLNRLFRNHFSHRQALYLREHHDLNTSQLLRDITLEFNQHKEELSLLYQLNQLQRSRVAQTTQNLAMAQQRFRLGLVTQLEIDKVALEHLNSQIDLQENHYALILKKLQIDHLLSNPLHNN